MTSQHPSFPGPSQQSQHLPPSSSSHKATTPPPLPPDDDRNLFLHGPDCYGPLHNLHWQFRLEEDGSHYLVSSAYKPLKGKSRDVSTSPANADRKKAAQQRKGKSEGADGMDADAGRWQVRAARFREDGSAVDWYLGEWCGSGEVGEDVVRIGRIKDLLVKSKSPHWSALESRIQAAFRDRDLTVAVHRRDVEEDGTWSQLQLILGRSAQSESAEEQQTQSQWQASAASSSSAPAASTPIHLSLPRLTDQESSDNALLMASYLCADLMRSNTILESSLALKQSKLQHARRLAGIAPGSGGPREMAYAASLGLGPGGGSQSVSLVNPGRIKRKRVDDEGFEEDSEEEDEENEEGDSKVDEKGGKKVVGAVAGSLRGEQQEDKGGSQTEEEEE